MNSTKSPSREIRYALKNTSRSVQKAFKDQGLPLAFFTDEMQWDLERFLLITGDVTQVYRKNYPELSYRTLPGLLNISEGRLRTIRKAAFYFGICAPRKVVGKSGSPSWIMTRLGWAIYRNLKEQGRHYAQEAPSGLSSGEEGP